MNISERLKKVRKSKNISIYKLSKQSGISETHIRDLERGDRNPSFDTLNRLVEPLGLSLSELFNESDNIAYVNSSEKELLECFRMLSDDKANSLLAFVKTLV